LLISKNPHLITTTLSNIFTMRLIGNKTHGDLAEIAIAEFINQFMYGSGTANALQRGLWTHTKNGLKYFDSVTAGWIDYSHNHVLVKLFSYALLSTSKGHEAALLKLKEDIEEQKLHSKLG
jgi:hypothetical protein